MRALIALASTLAATAGAAPLEEAAPVPPVAGSPHARIVNASWIQLVLPETPYATSSVQDASAYSITSSDDPAYGAAVHPSLVHRRHWPEEAWYPDRVDAADPGMIRVTYRIFLKVSPALQEGRHYSVSVAASVAPVGTLAVAFDQAPNEAIHVNQVAYPAVGPKVAYLSAWTGQAAVAFDPTVQFEVVDEGSGKAVFQGPVRLDVTADPFSGSDVYSLDFSAFAGAGRFHLRVPGVGASYPFSVGGSAFNRVGYTVLRGLTLQRDGDHGLDDPAVTHWSRPPAHLDDAIDQATGQRIDLVGGHMDAGDRGKYPQNLADVACTLLSAMALLPDAVAAVGESLQIPESGNGIPDVIDEAVYELDYLAKSALNTSRDGAQPEYLHPADDGYEQGYPLEGATGRIFFNVKSGPYPAQTLYVAGALAMAAASPMLQQHVPAKLSRYRQGAERLFACFESHKDEAGFFKPDLWKAEAAAHTWSPEMLIAAASLYQLTGEQKYLDWITSELPANLDGQRQWDWVLEGPWLNAFVALSQVTRPAFPAAHRDAAKAAIKTWADSIHKTDYYPSAPFGVPLLRYAQTGQIGWYFSPSAMGYPLMLAWAVSKDAKYRDELVRLWSWELGTNPLSRTFVSGLGQPDRRPRWIVHEISQYQFAKYRQDPSQGWSEMTPGILSADLQEGYYEWFYDDPANVARKDAKFPDTASTPALYRYHDSWTVKDEFVIAQLARGAVSLLPLMVAAQAAAPDAGAADGAVPASRDAGVAAADAAAADGGRLPEAKSGCGCGGTGEVGAGLLAALLALVRRPRAPRRPSGRASP